MRRPHSSAVVRGGIRALNEELNRRGFALNQQGGELKVSFPSIVHLTWAFRWPRCAFQIVGQVSCIVSNRSLILICCRACLLASMHNA